MIKFSANTKKQLIDLYKSKNIGLEGNILKLVDAEDDTEFLQYVKTCIDDDKESRKKRLEMTKQIQKKNNELETLNTENSRILGELQTTLDSSEFDKKQIECQNNELLSWKEENERTRCCKYYTGCLLKDDEARLVFSQATEGLWKQWTWDTIGAKFSSLLEEIAP